MKVPFIDLNPQFRLVDSKIEKAFSKVLKSRQFILGSNVVSLEKEIAKRCGVKHAIGVSSGSDALYLVLLACGVGPGDEVITTPFTFFATGGSISRIGAKPVFVDIDPKTFNIDPSQIEKAITKKTKAILPVHIYGLCADLEPIQKIAKKYNLKVVEDAAQSYGAIYKGKNAGSIADAGCLSFYPTKNLGGCGDGGMVLTSDDKIADQIKLYRDYGSRKKYYHEIVGFNCRLDDLQAAVLLIKLQYIERWNKERNQIASRYNALLKNVSVTVPFVPKNQTHVFHLYTLLVEKRDALREFLTAKGIGTGIYYPVPLHLQECYKELGYQQGDLPVTESVSERMISLPMFNGLTLGAQKHVVAALRLFFE